MDVKAMYAGEWSNLPLSTLWQYIINNYTAVEEVWVKELIDAQADITAIAPQTKELATHLIATVRQNKQAAHAVDQLLQQYNLGTKEGVLLMCLAESLIRTPDNHTADDLIKDKLSIADWSTYLKKSDSILVNASTWGLMLTGKIVKMDTNEDGTPAGVMKTLVNRMGEPVIRKAIQQAMKIMGQYFILGTNIQKALKRGKPYFNNNSTYSFDMLGEAAITQKDALHYKQNYQQAIEALGQFLKNNEIDYMPSISIKLSSLHPRYEATHSDRVLSELLNTMVDLIKIARQNYIAVTIDAEEQDRLEISLKLFEKLYQHPAVRGWGGLGLVVQAYGKRALPVLCWLAALAKQQGDIIPVRLVKGAYWDSEIKWSQQKGAHNYPVYTRKNTTDLAYMACARFLLEPQVQSCLFPQFATHNAYTISQVINLAKKFNAQFEMQRLHGMGEPLYNEVQKKQPIIVRIYAPVGNYKDLQPYLVRRLLENGANSSFVHRLVDLNTDIETLVQDPIDSVRSMKNIANDKIPLPKALFEDRLNSLGVNLYAEVEAMPFIQDINQYITQEDINFSGCPVINGKKLTTGPQQTIYSPFDKRKKIGACYWSTDHMVNEALENAYHYFKVWNNTPVSKRSELLDKLADLIDTNKNELIALCHLEAGKTVQDSIDEIREAIDFCRYYAQEARNNFSTPVKLPGPTGESNELYYQGRGVFFCISPWNFPIAIFTGQIVAALVTGNCVLIKPAEQTTLVAMRLFDLMLETGFPCEAIQFLPGSGAHIGQQVLKSKYLSGIVFTGSTDTAHILNKQLAERPGAMLPLIAETGGQNAMLVDSTALPEQVVIDVIASAFHSAGQRCSALRVLYLQEDIADRVIELLKGAMAELKVGLPYKLKTDVGPIIDEKAQQLLNQHIKEMESKGKLIAQSELLPECEHGYFIAPTAFEIDSIQTLTKEHFGPILHIVRYQATQIDQIIKEINSTGFGLTFGIHTRNDTKANYLAKNIVAGNVYINRNQIGAQVGVQPFGGMGLSGTGPKAGGPNYLFRFCVERVCTNNITAIGGNATLLEA